MNVILTIRQDKIFDEVAKTSDYTASKAENSNDDIRDRMLVVDEDQELLLRFWEESKTIACNALKRVLSSEKEEKVTATATNKAHNKYTLTLNCSSSFDSNLTASMQQSLFSFFVMTITAKWYAFTNKAEAADFAQEAAVHIEDILRKALYKKKPARPKY